MDLMNTLWRGRGPAGRTGSSCDHSAAAQEAEQKEDIALICDRQCL